MSTDIETVARKVATALATDDLGDLLLRPIFTTPDALAEFSAYSGQKFSGCRVEFVFENARVFVNTQTGIVTVATPDRNTCERSIDAPTCARIDHYVNATRAEDALRTLIDTLTSGDLSACFTSAPPQPHWLIQRDGGRECEGYTYTCYADDFRASVNTAWGRASIQTYDQSWIGAPLSPEVCARINGYVRSDSTA